MGCSCFSSSKGLEGNRKGSFSDQFNNQQREMISDGYRSTDTSPSDYHCSPSGANKRQEGADIFSKSTFLSDFQVLKMIGRGRYTKVFLVNKCDNLKYYAMKVCRKSKLTKSGVSPEGQEKRIFQQLDHPFLTKLYHSFETQDKLYYILEPVTGGNLEDYMLRKFQLKEKAVRFYAAELVSALKCLHDNEVIYKDLKPKNILIDAKGHIKLQESAFWTMKNLEKVKGSKCGTSNYIAPEIMTNGSHTKMSDLWSLGAVVYEMISGYPPFLKNDSDSEKVKFTNVINNQIQGSKKYSPALKDFLDKILRIDPEERLGSNGLEEVMKHSFFEGIDWIKVNARQLTPPFIPKWREQSEEINNPVEEDMFRSIEEQNEHAYFEEPATYTQKYSGKFGASPETPSTREEDMLA